MYMIMYLITLILLMNLFRSLRRVNLQIAKIDTLN